MTEERFCEGGGHAPPLRNVAFRNAGADCSTRADGGYAGYFADPDGHLWEIAHNPGFPLAEDGSITIPDFGSL